MRYFILLMLLQSSMMYASGQNKEVCVVNGNQSNLRLHFVHIFPRDIAIVGGATLPSLFVYRGIIARNDSKRRAINISDGFQAVSVKLDSAKSFEAIKVESLSRCELMVEHNEARYVIIDLDSLKKMKDLKKIR